MDTMTPDFLQEVKEKGEYLRSGIAALNSPYVSGIRGMGLMIGVGVQGMTHKELKDKLMARGPAGPYRRKGYPAAAAAAGDLQGRDRQGPGHHGEGHEVRRVNLYEEQAPAEAAGSEPGGDL